MTSPRIKWDSGQRVRWPEQLGNGVLFGSGQAVWQCGRECCKEVRAIWGLGCSGKASSDGQRPSRTELDHPSTGFHLSLLKCPSPNLSDIPDVYQWTPQHCRPTALSPSCPLTFKNVMSLSQLKCFMEAQWWWYHWGNKSSTNRSWVQCKIAINLRCGE